MRTTTDTFTTIDLDQLATLHGGFGSGAAYGFGYGAGWGVTRVLEQTEWGGKIVPDPAQPSRSIPRADIPVIGPKLTSWGLRSMGAGATDSVNDLANQHAR
jgi:hypothetical protein